jgi:nitroreductase
MEDKEKIRALASAVRAEKERIGGHIAADFAPSFLAYGDYFTRFENAPVVIAPAARPLAVLSNLVNDDLDPETRAKIARMESESGLIGTSLALGNLLLCAHALGLGASAMTGPLIARSQVTHAFGIPDGWSVVALVALGYPDEVPNATDRKDAKSVTRYVK